MIPCLLFKKYIKITEISGFKLGLLAEFIKVPLVDAHNAEDDALCLKNICETFTKEKGLSLDEFLSNYTKHPSEFLKKILAN